MRWTINYKIRKAGNLKKADFPLFWRFAYIERKKVCETVPLKGWMKNGKIKISKIGGECNVSDRRLCGEISNGRM